MSERKALYRNKETGKIAGVCSGIAEFLGWETWLVRILTLTGFMLLAPPFFLVAYVACWFILDVNPNQSFTKGSHGTRFRHSGKGWRNTSTGEDKKVEIKSKVWQSGEPPKQAFGDIKKQFELLEKRLRGLESYVTSSEFQLKREINRL